MQLKLSIISLMMLSIICAEPNPPYWDSARVKILDPADPSGVQAIVNQVYAANGGKYPDNHGQWSNNRYALLFLPGTHQVDVNVGYYTQVLGLGATPYETTLRSLTSENGSPDYHNGALCNFWRSAENVQVNTGSQMVWAVSQAAPLRRIVVNGNLELFQDGGYASGGFMADVLVSGMLNTGSQQQFFIRNTKVGRTAGGVWNMLYMGCENSPATKCGPFTNIPKTPIIAEKPYITIQGTQFKLNIPRIEMNKYGNTPNFQNSEIVDFSQVFVAKQSDSAATINAILDQGLHVVFQPGNYVLTDSIKINRPNTVLLGIGMATLISESGKPCIEVGNVDGVRISGVLLQASTVYTESLLKWGSVGYKAVNPSFMHDIFVRVGGTNNPALGQNKAKYMVQVNSDNVVVDNTWLWRADHDIIGNVYNSNNPVDTGFQANGDNIIAYSLAVEHTLGNMVEWNGNNGQTYLYQSEFPYDVTQEQYGDKGFVGYLVNDNVTNHNAYGLGVYSFFRDHEVFVKSSIKGPNKPGVIFENSLSVYLSGYGGIKHIVNDQGDAVQAGIQVKYLCKYVHSEKENEQLEI